MLVTKRLAKSFLLRTLPLRYIRLYRFLNKAQWRLEQVERNMQRISMYLAFQEYTENRSAKSVINRYEFGIYSQNGEDGILLYIFSQIGTTNRSFVEFGIEDGRECNSANLAINFGWCGLLMDIDEKNVASARNYYDAMLGERKQDIQILNRMITAENINSILKEANVPSEPDLFSIDIDSNDYWIWKALEVVRPRVMIVEFNPVFGPDRPLTIPYQKDAFNRFTHHYSGFYFGAALTALYRLAQQKGYALVGCDSVGSNAFFVRQDVLVGELRPLTPQQAYYRSAHYYSDVRQDGNIDPPEQFPYIAGKEFVEIGESPDSKSY